MLKRPIIDYEAYLKFASRLEAAADPPAVTELTVAEDHRTAIKEIYVNGYRRGHSTGWRCLDPFFTLRGGEFTVITGFPGHGKSVWLDNLMVNMARFQKWHWAVFSAENYPVARYIAGLSEIYTGKPFGSG